MQCFITIISFLEVQNKAQGWVFVDLAWSLSTNICYSATSLVCSLNQINDAGSESISVGACSGGTLVDKADRYLSPVGVIP